MPRRDDKHNAPCGGRARPFRGGRRSAAAEGNDKGGPGKAFDKRGHAGKDKDKRRDFRGKREERAFRRDDDFRKKSDPPRQPFHPRGAGNEKGKPWPRRDERHDERPKFGRPRWERNGDRKRDAGDRKRDFGDRKGAPGDRKRVHRQREERGRPASRMDWQEHPRSDKRFAKRWEGKRDHGDRE